MYAYATAHMYSSHGVWELVLLLPFESWDGAHVIRLDCKYPILDDPFPWLWDTFLPAQLKGISLR